MNAERRVQRVRKAIEPPGEARTDWQIMCTLAERMGHGSQFRYDSPEEIWSEIRQVWPEAAGITYARIDQEGLQWPCRSEVDPGTTILHTSQFGQSPQAALRRIEFHPSPEQVSEEFPLLLSTGRSLYQFNSGTMTMRTKNKKLRPSDVLDICEVDAKRLNIKGGELVRVRSRYGNVQMKAHITNSVDPGELFATFHDKRVDLNRITGPFRDGIVQAPEYKVTAVCVTPLN